MQGEEVRWFSADNQCHNLVSIPEGSDFTGEKRNRFAPVVLVWTGCLAIQD